MKVRYFVLVAVLLVFVSVSPAMPQDANCTHRFIAVSISDGSFAPVTDLTSSDLQAEMHGKPVQIVSISDAQEPRRIVIELDTSQTMQGQTGERWGVALSVAERLVNMRFPNAQLALYVFGQRANVKVPFSQNNVPVVAALQQIQNDASYAKEHLAGNADIAAAILDGMKFFESPRPGDAIYIVTDDGRAMNKEAAQNLREAAESSGIRLFFCALTLDGRLQNESASGEMQEYTELADASGGMSIGWIGGSGNENIGGSGPFAPLPPTDSERRRLEAPLFAALAKALQVAFAEMVNIRRVELILPSAPDRPEKLKLSLTKQALKRVKSAALDYPHEISPCGAAGAS